MKFIDLSAIPRPLKRRIERAALGTLSEGSFILGKRLAVLEERIADLVEDCRAARTPLVGLPQADDLGLDGGPLYDPLGNYRRVAGNWNDWAGDPKHPTVATSTVTPAEQPAQGVTPRP